MCFSATASFVAGTALTATGAVTISRAKGRKELPLASMPMLFGIQQLVDGVVWTSFSTPLIHVVATYGYAFIAYVLWPIFVPITVLTLEKDPKRRRVLEALVIVGVSVGLFALYLMLSGPVTARVINQCIRYDLFYPYPLWVLSFYLVATCGSFFVSSKKFLRVFGIAIFISFSIAGWFYVETFPSVWCFFAAVLSAMIYWYFRHR